MRFYEFVIGILAIGTLGFVVGFSVAAAVYMQYTPIEYPEPYFEVEGIDLEPYREGHAHIVWCNKCVGMFVGDCPEGHGNSCYMPGCKTHYITN